MPSSPHTMVLHGHRLSYLDRGDGPVVLFIHGILGSQHNWKHLVNRMDDTQRVIVPDLFGHGASAKPMGDYSLSSHAATLRDLLDRLGIDTVTVVGHSLGGGIAMQFFYLFPERVERLVLVASGGLGREVSPLLRSATLPGAEQVLSVVASGWVLGKVESVGRTAARIGWKPGADVGAIWRGFTSLGDRESRKAFLATTRAVVDPGGQTISAHDHLAHVRPIPVLLVWGTKDRMIPAWHAINAQKSVPSCRVELFPGAGHFPHLDDPDRFADVLADFIASTAIEE
ncbi:MULTISPECIES: alpha/beta fold hydrolase [Aeromicrobium]|nr:MULTISPECIES: alpha/beta fold hydrolase [Aeromicrobium]MCD9152836.1 alpha/beta fold hydrolase [Aeromicrobium duanguangcaii]MCL3837161.1 alpha/beta fold hydrolase [Aeromicrobium duanguangcaii]UUI67184.1 alpha/beta fold hydrolase [Aeromicrobium duanguangcaii]